MLVRFKVVKDGIELSELNYLIFGVYVVHHKLRSSQVSSIQNPKNLP